jgi:hypothetical protein
MIGIGRTEQKFELGIKSKWTPASANVVITGLIGNKKIEFVAKRQGYTNIDYSLDIFGDKITFVNVNNIRSKVNFDVKATLTIAQKLAKMIGIGHNEQKIELGIKSKRANGALNVEGTLSLNGRSYEIKFENVPGEHKFKLTLKPSSGANFFVAEVKDKTDGRVLTLQVTGKTLQIFENLSTRTVGDLSSPIEIKMTENLQNTKLTFNLDI